MDVNDLKHFGILGMHWGRRKTSKTKTKTKSKTTPKITSNHPDSEDHKTKEYLNSKKLKHLTNAEIKMLTERIDLEKKYKEMKKEDVSAGRKYISNLIKSVGDESVKMLIRTHLPQALTSIVTNIRSVI